ncbi:helix-turn-helix domain-containing protein [Alishewanella sp. 16-MA]|uniref:Helix-turn-helix domain-containing protein n=1 Tax=Alishewanella maricola TaxID=2795740 RepID=A0ABS8C1M1_9ALTE|nr:helix-turn-helix transcriptional regulator [Alishewanella maricola]MCB5226217.1 helix-turn-helix domain-containing protein [Alishewanella maricola]
MRDTGPHGGLILKLIRERKGFTQEQVSEIMGIARRTYQRWEAGESEPEFGLVFMICECVFKVELLDAITIAREYEIERKRA